MNAPREELTEEQIGAFVELYAEGFEGKDADEARAVARGWVGKSLQGKPDAAPWPVVVAIVRRANDDPQGVRAGLRLVDTALADAGDVVAAKALDGRKLLLNHAARRARRKAKP